VNGTAMFIMGGSSIYTLLLLEAMGDSGLLQHLDKITLFGRDPRKLEVISRLGEAKARDAGFRTLVDTTTDFETCLEKEYCLIFNQIRFGGMVERDRDEKIAIRSGLPADETLGIVGVSNAIRTITGMRRFLDILCEKRGDFLTVNFTNPCSIVTQYLTEELGGKVLGICDYPVYFSTRIAEFMDVPPTELRIAYFGLNHFAFVYDIETNGQSVFQALMDRVEEFPLALPVQPHFEYLFVPSWAHVFGRERLVANQVREKSNRAESLLRIEKDFATLMQSGTLDPSSAYALLQRRNCSWYESAVVPLLERCLGVRGGEAIVNLDAGNIFGLGKRHCVVEANTIVTNGRAHMLEVPKSIQSSSQFQYCRTMKQVEKLLLDGILQNDADLVLQACLLNPMIQSAKKIGLYFSELAQADIKMRPYARSTKSY
jgi:6-phospho-beta-glucosidase